MVVKASTHMVESNKKVSARAILHILPNFLCSQNIGMIKKGVHMNICISVAKYHDWSAQAIRASSPM